MKPELPEGLVALVEHHHVEDAVYMGHDGPVGQADLVPGKDSLPVVTPITGYTLASIYKEDDPERKQPLALGIAMCGEQDQFFFNVGRDIALGRAIKKLEEKQALMGAEIL